MFTLLGWSLIGSSFVAASYPAFESVFLKKLYRKRKLIENLNKAFVNGKFYNKVGDNEIYPHLLKIDQQSQRTTFVFSIPKGHKS